MKRLTFLMIAVAFVAWGCNRGARAGASSAATQTIAPASPVPGQPTQNGTDALTQTTEVEDSRSEAEGGVSTAPPTAKAPAKAPAKKKRK